MFWGLLILCVIILKYKSLWLSLGLNNWFYQQYIAFTCAGFQRLVAAVSTVIHTVAQKYPRPAHRHLIWNTVNNDLQLGILNLMFYIIININSLSMKRI